MKKQPVLHVAKRAEMLELIAFVQFIKLDKLDVFCFFRLVKQILCNILNSCKAKFGKIQNLGDYFAYAFNIAFFL